MSQIKNQNKFLIKMSEKTPLKRVLLLYVLKPLLLGFLGLVIFSLVGLLSTRGIANASSNSTINFQARLLTSAGTIVPDGNYNVEFKLYNAATSSGSSQGSCSGDSNCLWVETWTGGNTVRVVNGYLSVQLGSLTAFPSTINWNQNLWLGMNVGGSGGSPTWDGEMTPRIAVTATPYSFTAGELETFNSVSGYSSILQFTPPALGNETITLPDATGTVCLQTSSACGFVTTGGLSGTAFVQGGNSFGTAALLGTNDNNPLNLETDGHTLLSLGTGGSATFGSAGSIAGSLVLNNASNTNTVTINTGATANTYSLTLPVNAPSTGLCLQTSTASSSQLIFASCANTNASITEVNEWDSHGSNTTTLSVSPASVGDLLVMTTQIPTSSDPVTSVSGGGVTTWTKVNVSPSVASVNRVEMWMGTVTTAGSSSITVNYTSNPGTNEIAATEFTAAGVSSNTTWGVDSTGISQNTGSSTTIAYPSLTSEGNAEVYIGYAQSQTTGSAGSTAGFTYKVTGQNNVITYNTPTSANTLYSPSAVEVGGESNAVGAIITAFVSSTAINNSTSLQEANFNVQAASSGSIAGVLQANASGSGDILDLENGSGSKVVTFSSTGQTTLDNSTNSTTAFQVQNSSGANVLDADTSNSRVGVDVTYAPMSSPSGLTLGQTSGGSLTTTATYKYEITALDSAGGETTPSSEVSISLTGSNKTVTLYWTAVAGASGYNIYRTAANGTTGSEVYLTTVLSNYTSGSPYSDTGTITAGAATPPLTTTAYTSSATSNNKLQISVGGNGTPTGQLYVSGTVSATNLGSTSSNLVAPNSVYVSGNYAYITNHTNNELVIDDISNPADPTYIGEIGTNLNVPNDVYVQGRYAYVTSSTNSELVVFDISNPASPTSVGEVGTNLSGPDSVYVQGRYAYVTSSTNSELVVFDISNPASPTYAGELGTNLSSPTSVYVQGRYAYVTSFGNSELVIDNVSNPASPTYAGELGTNLSSPRSVYVSGRYAYVISGTGSGNSDLVIYDISNPGTPVYSGETTTNLNVPYSVYVQGRYAYVASSANSELVTYDVSNPTDPFSVGEVSSGLSSPRSLFVQGRYAYVASYSSGQLVTFDLGGAYVQQLQAGGTETGTLTVDTNATVNGDQSIAGGLTVGGNAEISGNLGVSGQTLLQNLSNSTTSFQVGNASGLGLLNTDTTDGRVGIGSLTTPTGVTATLASGGSLATGSTYYFRVSAIDGSSGETAASAEATGSAATSSGNQEYNVAWTAVPGAASYRIYYTTTAGTEANYFTSTTNSYTLSTTTGNTAGSPLSYSYAYADRLSSTSNIFQTLTNSTTALQVQTSSGSAVLTTDTTNSRVGVDVTYATMTSPSGLSVNAATSGGSLTASSTYRYEVTALDSAGGETTVSNEATGTTGSSTLTLPVTWTAVSGASGYKVYRTAASGGSGSEVYLTTVLTNSFTDSGQFTAGTATPPTATTAYISTNASSAKLQLSVGGNGTPTGQLYVSGTVPSGPVSSISTGTNPFDVYTQGNYAYVVSKTANDLQIYDISNPVDPYLESTISTGASTGPESVYVQGRYAYVTNNTTSTFEVFDISNPATPVSIATVSTGSSSGPEDVVVSGRYAYVVNDSTNVLVVFDVSNPANPVIVNGSGTATGTAPQGIFISSHYAYIVNHTSGTLQVFDISNPASPVNLSTWTTSSGPDYVYVAGRYAYVVTHAGDTLQIFDVSNPAATTNAAVSSTTVPGSGDPIWVYVQGRYAYITNNNNGTVQVYDVSNPAAPVSDGTMATSGASSEPSSIFVSGRYAYVTVNGSSNTLQVFDLGGAYVQQLQAGGAEVGTLTVDTNAQINGDQSIAGGLTVGGSAQVAGNATLGGLTINGVATPAAPTVTPTCVTSCTTSYSYAVAAFNTSGSSPASTATSTSAAGATLSGTVYNTVTWSAVTGATGYNIYRTASGGTPSTTGYIGTVYTGATLSFADKAITATGTTPTTNTAGALVADGTALFQDATNSTTAFQVQTSTGSDVLEVNTANPGIAIDATYGSLSAPTGLSVSTTGSAAGDALGTATYYYKVTAVDGNGGETTPSGEVSHTFASGTTNYVTLTWTPVTGAAGYRVYRGTSSGGETGYYSILGSLSSGNVTFTDTGAVMNNTTATPPSANTSSVLTNTSNNNLQLVVGGNGTETGQVYIGGTLPSIAGSVQINESGPHGSSMYTQGNYMYVVNNDTWTLQVFNVSNPADPILLNGTNTITDSGPLGIFVEGNYAYVVGQASNFLQIFNVSDPYNPIAMGTIDLTDSNAPDDVYVSGNYAYVVGSAFHIINISNPANPILMSNDTNISNGGGLYVQGNYAYVTEYASSGSLNIINVSNPLSPVTVGTTATIAYPAAVIVQGSYAYVSDYNGGGGGNIDVYDITNPASPVDVGGPNAGGTYRGSLVAQGRYLYLTSSSGITVLDISNPYSLTPIGTISTPTGVGGIVVQGRYAYVQGTNYEYIYNLGGAYVQQLQAGGTETGTLTVDTNATVDGDQSIAGALTVGGSAYVSGGIGSNGLTVTGLIAPTAPTVAPQGTTGSTTYGYAISAFDTGNSSSPSPVTLTTTGNATLSGTNYNKVTWSAVTDVSGYNIYRTFGGGSTGLIGTVYAGSTLQLNDTGLTASGTVPTTINNTTNVFNVQTGSGSTTLSANTGTGQVSIDNTASTLSAPTSLAVSTTGSSAGDSLGTATYYYEVTAIDSNGGETIPSAEVNHTFASGTTNYVTLTWTAVTGASGYHVYRGTSSTKEAGYYTTLGSLSGTTVSFTDTGAAMNSTTATPPTVNTSYLSSNTTNNNLQLVIGGNGTPTGQVYVSGTVPTSNLGAIGTGLVTPESVYVQGNYAYVPNLSNGELVIYDISNPANPVYMGETNVNLGSSYAVYVQGRYAYVPSYANSELIIYDVSNPANPVYVGETSTNISSPWSVYVQGSYAYTINSGNGELVVDNIANPANPVYVGETSTNLSSPWYVYIQGHYAYVASEGNNELVIYDISNPSNPVYVGEVGTNLNDPEAVYVQGRYAYVASYNNNELVIDDISNPSNPVYVGEVGTNLSNPHSVYVQGRYAYVASKGNNELITYDVSNPANPVYVGEVGSNLSAPRTVVVSGRYGYVISASNNELVTFDLGGAYIQQLQAGGAEVATLTVDTNATINGDQSIAGGLTVAGSAQISGAIGSNGLTITGLTTPTAPTVAPQGTTGSTTYGYAVSAFDTGNSSPPSPVTLTTTGNATLSGTNYNQITWSAVTGATGYNIYRTFGGGSTGLIGTIYTGSTLQLNDTGLTASGTVPTTVNNTTNVFNVQTGSGSTTLSANTATGQVSIDNTASTLSAPTSLAVGSTGSSAGDSLGTATYYYKVTAIDSNGGETTPSTEVSHTFASGTTNYVTLTWTAVTGASGYHVYRGTSSGKETGYYTTLGLISSGTTVTFTDTGAIMNNTTASPPSTNTSYLSSNTTNNNLQLVVGGNGTPTGQVYISGTVPTTSLGTSAGGYLSGPNSVYTQGSYAYVTSQYTNELVVYDVSNPANPAYIGEIGTNLNDPYSIYVQGNYAYVASYGNNELVIYDISNPASPTYVGETGTAYLNEPRSIDVQGRYAYVANYNNNEVVIFDVSNPSNPTYVGETGTTYLNDPNSVTVSGHYAYVLNNGSSEMVIYNISNPASPTYVGENNTDLNGPGNVIIQGRYAYIASWGDGLTIYDVSNPASPTPVSEVTTNLSGTIGISVQGRYAYVTSYTNNEFVTFDVSNPASPNYVGEVSSNLSSPNFVSAQGRYAYVTSSANNELVTFDLGGAYVQQLQAGGTETGTLAVDTNATVGGDQTIAGGLTVGGNTELSGNLGIAGQAMLENTTNTTTAFEVANSSAGSLFDADTTDNETITNGSAIVNSGTCNYNSYVNQVMDYAPTSYWKMTDIGGSTELDSSGNGNTGNLQGTVTKNQTPGPIGCNNSAPAMLFNGSTGYISTTNSYTNPQTFTISGFFKTSTAGAGPIASFDSSQTGGGSSWDRLLYIDTNGYLNFGIYTGSDTVITSTQPVDNGQWHYVVATLSSSGMVLYVDGTQVASSATSTAQNYSGYWRIGGEIGTGWPLAGSNTFFNGDIGQVSILPVALTGSQVTQLAGQAGYDSSTSSTSTFQVQNAAGVDVLNVDTTNSRVDIGSNGTPTSQLYVSGSVPTTNLGIINTGLSSPESVDVVGNYAYVTDFTNNALLIFDISNPASPSSVGSTTSGLSDPQSVYVQGKYAYVVNYNSPGALVIFNVSNPASPVEVGSYSTSVSYLSGIYVSGRYAYVASSSNGLLVFDVSNPTDPVLAGSTNSFLSSAKSVYVQGRYAYVTSSGNNDLVIFDINNPASPSEVGAINTNLSSPQDVYVQNDYAYVTSPGNSKLAIFNVSSPSSPSASGAISTSLSSPYDVYVQGRYAYVTSSGNNELVTYDVSTPSSPAYVGELSNNMHSPYGIYVQGRYAYVTNTTGSSLVTVDLGGAYIQQLQAGGIETGTLTVDSNAQVNGDQSIAGGLTVGGNVQISGNLGVSGAVTITDSLPSTNLGINTTSLSGPFSVYVSGHYAYIANFTGGLSIDDISNPASPVNVGSDTTGITTATSVYVQGKYAYLTSNGNSKLVIVDISNPSAPTNVSATTGGGDLSSPFDVYVSGHYAYVASSGNGEVVVFDISNPTNPTVVSQITGLSSPHSLYVQGRYLYVTNYGSSALDIFDISNPASPSYVTLTSTNLSNPISIVVQGNYAYVASYGSGANYLVIFNISVPGTPTYVGEVNTNYNAPYGPQSLSVQGHFVYVANNASNSVQIYDVSNPAAPAWAGSLTGNLSTDYGVAVSGQYAYVASYTNNSLVTFNLGGAYIQQLQVGGAETNTLQVDGNSTLIGDVSIQAGLTVGASAEISGSLGVAGGNVVLGTSNSLSGALVLNNSTNTNTVTLTSGAATSSYSLTLPTNAPTTGLCLQTSTASASQLVFSSCANTNASITEVNEWDAHGAATTTLSDSPANIGDLLVLTTQIPTGSDSVSSISGGGVTTWTKVNVAPSGGSVNRVEMWMGTVTTTGAGTITVTYASGPGTNEITATEFTAAGVNSSTVWGVDKTGASLNSSSNTISYPNLTSEGAGEVYVGYAQAQNAGTAGSYTGFSYIVTGQNNVITYDTSTAAATAYTPTATEATAGQSNAVGAIITAFVSSTSINNSTTVQQANFNVQAAGSGSVAGVLQANAAGTGDILDLKNGSGTIVGSIGSTGNTLIEPSTNSTTAFQVQNATGGNILSVDTSGSNVTIDGTNNGALGTWQTNTNNLPASANLSEVVTSNGYAYVLGGSTGSYVTTVDYAKISANGSIGTWTATTSLPAAQGGGDGVVANGYIYVYGGSNSGGSATGNVWYAKINSDGTVGSWQTSPNSLSPVNENGVGVTANGYLYELAGSNGSSDQTAVYYSKLNADGSIGTWTSTSTVPAGVSSFSATVANGYVYIFGHGGPSVGPAVYYSKLNATTGALGTWSTNSSNPLPISMGATEAVTQNGYAYVFGGYNSSYTNINTLYYAPLNANGSTGAWTLGSTLPSTDAEHAGGFAVNGYIYALANNGTNAIYYVSGARTSIAGSLDLVGVSGQDDSSSGATGGSLTAGNTTVVGTLQVSDTASFLNGVSVDDSFNVVGGASFTGIAPSSAAGTGTNAPNVLTITGQAGGATSGTSGQTAGAGSAISQTAGAGGAATGASGANNGGTGGTVTIASGAGGAVSSASAIPGVGGGINITAGAGGAGTSTSVNANGGAITLQGGAPGTGGSGAVGAYGSILIQPSGGMVALGTGTAYSLLTIANNNWITSVNAAGTGSDDILKVNSADQVQFGAAINVDGGLVFPTDGGLITASDLPLDSSATSGTSEGYFFRVASDNVLEVDGTSDGAGNTQSRNVTVYSGASQATDILDLDNATGSSTLTKFDSNGNLTLPSTITSTASTANIFNTVASTVNAFGVAGTINIGAAGASIIGAGALTIQSASSTSLTLNGQSTLVLKAQAAVASSNNAGGIIIGNGYSSSTSSLIPLILSSSNTFAETSNTCAPTVNNGALYYNSNSTSLSMRVCLNASWRDVLTNDDLGIMLFGVVPDSGGIPGDIASNDVTNQSGPCKVSWLSSTSVSVTACTLYTSDRKIVQAATTITGLNGTSDWYHLCYTGSSDTLAASTGGTETANLPAWNVSAGPVVCLADVETGGSNTITNIYDTRVFTTSTKTFATDNGVVGLGWMVKASSTSGLVTPTTSATDGPILGVIVASSGAASTALPNLVIATDGPVFVKTNGTSTVGSAVIPTTTTGYSSTGTNSTAYGNLGVSQITVSSSCSAATNCQYSQLVDVDIK